ncbi:MAG: DNA-binding protein [Planctomycetota bacterium]|nr:MAG: DNA-binding protein [Planctomycetota bacterium]REJ93289.1 MAG: DNA-binding protein [Planctomycetota bacterium]REK30202.1 MAG: DNA-binding protein [Planctomycetota bacterium]REK49260.1 MAG: DNA-binding protein [Planctomycetota bacterium]
MAKRFYDLEETAEALGITAEAVNEMRSRNEIRGYRDGPTWKFKSEDVDRVAKELRDKRAVEPTPETPVDDQEDELELAIGDELPSEEEGSVLLSERELGAAASGSASTIIGDSPEQSSESSDLSLADSNIGLGKDAPEAGGVADPSQMSDVRLAGGSDVLGGGEPASELGVPFEELDSLELDFDGMTDSTAPAGGEAKSPPAEEDLSLASDSDLSMQEDLSLQDEPTETEDADQSVGLGDDDLVLGGSSGSDITAKPGDSGISLMDPSDSGLSLEEAPLELGGSSIVSSEPLALDEDEMLTLGDDGESPSAIGTEPQRDFDLNIEQDVEDASESGSQVIALDADEAFDPEAATMVGGALAADAAGMLGEEPQQELEAEEPDLGLVPQPVGTGFGVAALPEAPYSIWNVLALVVCVTTLSLCGIMMFDLVRNVWSWDQAYPVNSTLMDWILETFAG